LTAAAAIVLLGASFAEPGSPLAAELERVLKREVIARGVRGATLREWSSAANVAAWRSLPDGTALVLEMGGNGPVDEATVARVHAQLLTHFDDVYWVIPPRWSQSGQVAERRATATRAIRAAGVPIIDTRMTTSSRDVAGDGTHLSVYGYTRYARLIAAGVGGRARALRILRAAGIAAGALSLAGLVAHMRA
jgi:hypothetical protein